MQDKTSTPGDALGLLREGNRRFVSGMAEHPRQDHIHRKAISSSQQPFAAIVACSDSRMPVEMIFDCGFGDIFSIRTIGNTFTPVVLASAELAVAALEIPLLVVLGHSGCAAVKSVMQNTQVPGSVGDALSTIRNAASQLKGAQLADNPDAVIEANIWLTIEQLIHQSDLIRTRLDSGDLAVAAARCNTATSKVTWLEPPRR